MFFLDYEHVEMGKCFPKKSVFLFMLDAWFLKIILICYDFFVAAVIRHVAPKFTCKI